MDLGGGEGGASRSKRNASGICADRPRGPMPRPTAADKPETEDEEHLCVWCFACFPSLKQLRCHRTTAHGVRRPAHQYASGPYCPVCGVDFRTRVRCTGHLERGAAVCTAALRAGRIAPPAP